MKKKILIFIHSLIGGGAEGVCITIANGLTKLGWDVQLIVLHLNKVAHLDRLSKKVKVTNLNTILPKKSLLAIIKLLKNSDTENLLVLNNELAVILVWIKIFYLRKLNIIARNINTFSFAHTKSKKIGLNRIYYILRKRYYPKVNHVINQCKAMEKDLLSVLPTLQRKTGYIYNPLNINIEKAQNELNFSNIKRDNYLLCVGTLTGRKAFHLAIRGFAAISNQYPSLNLKLLGKGELEEELRSEANKLGVGEKVEFLGFQKDMIPFYAKAKATILTSLYEGFPNVLLESIALGTPVVAFDCPSGPKEIIINGQNGYLVNYLDEEDLVQKLAKTLNKTWNHKEVQKTAKKFSSKEIIHQYDKLLTKLFFSS